MIMNSLTVKERFSCALVSKAWAKAIPPAAAAATVRIVKHGLYDLKGLQQYLHRSGSRVLALQLHGCSGSFTGLPCTKLQELIKGSITAKIQLLHSLSMDGSLGIDLAAAASLTSLSLAHVSSASHEADVVAAVARLQGLRQLTWSNVQCGGNPTLLDSRLLQQLRWLTYLDLRSASAQALQHLGSLTKLQHLSLEVPYDWASAKCPGLQQLKALTHLHLQSCKLGCAASSISRLTALQELRVLAASPTDLPQLQPLTDLTLLCVEHMEHLTQGSAPLQLPSLQHLELGCGQAYVHVSYLARCMQLSRLVLRDVRITGIGTLVASSALHCLVMDECTLSTAGAAPADPHPWQQVFPGPGRLPDLTSLQLSLVQPALQVADLQRVVACCSGLQLLRLDTVQCAEAAALAHLPYLSSLHLGKLLNQQCHCLTQLTGLWELWVEDASSLTPEGVRQLAALQQLTSLGFASEVTFLPTAVGLAVQKVLSDNMQGCKHAIVNKVSSGGWVMHPWVCSWCWGVSGWISCCCLAVPGGRPIIGGMDYC